LLVVQHAADCPPASMGRWLTEAGCSLDVCHPYAGDVLPERLDRYAGLVVLGGPMGAGDDAAFAWLGPTKTLLAEAVRREVPALGVCLGHELLAVATGGRVVRLAAGPQVGLVPVARNRAGLTDRLLGPLPAGAVAVQWNNDGVVDLPPGAVPLAATEAGNQAYRLGPTAWGVQFHPEVTVETLEPWADDDVSAGRLTRGRADDVLAAVRHAAPTLTATWQPFTERFAAAARGDLADLVRPTMMGAPEQPSRNT
jgi:GMP synthase (glutamine-hydrolysing)